MPGWFQWTVNYITYEGLFTELWDERWFQCGMKAFGLLALEHKHIATFRQSKNGRLYVCCGNDEPMPVEEFLDGESLPIRHDPNFADLNWTPVEAVGHLLAELIDDEESR